jgi:hypothetical protein
LMNSVKRSAALTAALLVVTGLLSCGSDSLGHAAYVALGSANKIAGYR